MTFRETLDKHLRAIQERDLQALRETLPENELVLITSDGQLVRSVTEFLSMHQSWFAHPTWSLGVTPVHIQESPQLAVAVLRLDYRDTRPDGSPLHETSYLTLVFAQQGERWVMVQDQNTPIRTR